MISDVTREFINEAMEGMPDHPLGKLLKAACVVLLDSRISNWMNNYDTKAQEQLKDAVLLVLVTPNSEILK